MSIFEAIKRRRSIGKMTKDQPTRTQIEHKTQTHPTHPHHKVEPWKFIVLAGKAREELGGVMADSLATHLAGTRNEGNQALLDKERGKLLRAPVVIVAVAERPVQPDIVEIENIEAVASAVQNMLLTADEMGLGAIWRTGDAAYDTHVKKWLGLSAEEHIVAFLYVGFPAITVAERQPISFEEKTTWLGWEE